MNILREVKRAYWLWKQERVDYEKEAALLSLALGAYSAGACAAAVFANNAIPYERKGVVTHILTCRTGRGVLSPEEALRYYDGGGRKAK